MAFKHTGLEVKRHSALRSCRSQHRPSYWGQSARSRWTSGSPEDARLELLTRQLAKLQNGPSALSSSNHAADLLAELSTRSVKPTARSVDFDYITYEATTYRITRALIELQIELVYVSILYGVDVMYAEYDQYPVTGPASITIVNAIFAALPNTGRIEFKDRYGTRLETIFRDYLWSTGK